MKKEYTPFIILCICSILVLVLFALVIPIIPSRESYENVDYEWDDDINAYDVYIEDLGHFYIDSRKTTLIYAKEEKFKNLAVIQKRTSLLFHIEREIKLRDFYINIWMEMENGIMMDLLEEKEKENGRI